MNAKSVARCGIVSALGTVFLYGGGLLLPMGTGAAVLAGVCTALPLMLYSAGREGLLCYLATLLLGFLIVPRRSPVLLYALLFGLYPQLKFWVESRVRPALQFVVKLAYFTIALAGLVGLLLYGLFPVQDTILENPRISYVLMIPAAYFAFFMYDRGLSGLIATLRHRLTRR